jgi:hypothetical protein
LARLFLARKEQEFQALQREIQLLRDEVSAESSSKDEQETKIR